MNCRKIHLHTVYVFYDDVVMKTTNTIYFIFIACTICLYGCTKQETLIDNPILLRGEAGRLWLLSYSEEENSRYLCFDLYGQCQVFEFGVKKPILVIPDEYLPLNIDSCLDIPVLLNRLPYKMYQTSKEESGWVGYDEISGETFRILIRTFTPEDENFEWYQILHAHYTPKTEEIDWFLTPSFNLIENHPLNGRWESLSDSMILLNGHSFLIIEERKPLKGYTQPGKLVYFNRWVTLHNTETGNMIRLYDARLPIYNDTNDLDDFRAHARYKRWMKKWGKSIKKSILLKGEKFKLYHAIDEKENEHYWGHNSYAYFDASGIHTYLYPHDNGMFFQERDAVELNSVAQWHQQGNTVFLDDDQEGRYIIKEVSSYGDTIKLLDRNLGEILLVDVKLPPPRKKK